MKRLTLCCLVLACCCAASAGAETVRLKTGHVLTGDVLAQKAEFLVLDIGYTVLEVPRDQIEAVEASEEAAGPGPEAGKTGVLYRTAALKPGTVRDLVETFGTGVVKVHTPSGSGSGLIINELGHVITNAHVIEGETRVSVILFAREGGSTARRTVEDVQIVAVNTSADLALLKIEPPDDVALTPLYFGSIDRVRAGEPVFAIGNPFGLERSVSEGIVSHRARLVDGMLLLQTTAPINPGNSGGPLLNMRGEVVGVTNMKLTGMAEGLGFAVPIHCVRDFLKFRDAYAYDRNNPNTGYHYLKPPHAGGEGARSDEEQPEREDEQA